MPAELVNAACRIWMSLVIGYIRNFCASIPQKLYAVIVVEKFSTRYWKFEVILIRFCIEKYAFCGWLVVNFVRCRHLGETLMGTHCMHVPVFIQQQYEKCDQTVICQTGDKLLIATSTVLSKPMYKSTEKLQMKPVTTLGATQSKTTTKVLSASISTSHQLQLMCNRLLHEKWSFCISEPPLGGGLEAAYVQWKVHSGLPNSYYW